MLSGIDLLQQVFFCKFVSYFRLVGCLLFTAVLYVCGFTVLQETLGALFVFFKCFYLFILDDPIPLCMTNSCLTLSQSCVSLI